MGKVWVAGGRAIHIGLKLSRGCIWFGTVALVSRQFALRTMKNGVDGLAHLEAVLTTSSLSGKQRKFDFPFRCRFALKAFYEDQTFPVLLLTRVEISQQNYGSWYKVPGIRLAPLTHKHPRCPLGGEVFRVWNGTLLTVTVPDCDSTSSTFPWHKRM